jgi:hypothetical protein
MNILQRPVADRALDAATLCEAFQTTAATCPQRVALRTPSRVLAFISTEPEDRRRRDLQDAIEVGLRVVRTEQAGEQPTAALRSATGCRTRH